MGGWHGPNQVREAPWRTSCMGGDHQDFGYACVGVLDTRLVATKVTCDADGSLMIG